jgi:hypothetical protein
VIGAVLTIFCRSVVGFVFLTSGGNKIRKSWSSASSIFLACLIFYRNVVMQKKKPYRCGAPGFGKSEKVDSFKLQIFLLVSLLSAVFGTEISDVASVILTTVVAAVSLKIVVSFPAQPAVRAIPRTRLRGSFRTESPTRNSSDI